MTCFKGMPPVPEQEIRFKIVRIDKHFSFLEFKHIFKQGVNKDIMESITQDKRKILITLKEKLGMLVKK